MPQPYEPLTPIEDAEKDAEHQPLQRMDFTDEEVLKPNQNQSIWKRWIGRLGWVVAALLSLVLIWRFHTEIAEASAQSLQQIEALETKLKQAVSAQEEAQDQVQTQATATGKLDWSGIDTLFVFGDSYTSTGDVFHLPSIPSIDNPVDLSTNHFKTSPNWITWFTSTYNHTLFRAFNFAAGGSTVDDTLVKPYLVGTSLRRQISEQFRPKFVEDEVKYADWSAETSAFLVWFGVNDIHLSFQRDHTVRPPLAEIFDAYAKHVDELYALGARNLLFLTVPPFDRATPVAFHDDFENYSNRLNYKLEEIADIEAFNARLFKLRTQLREKYDDVSAYIFDTHAFFARVLETPEQFQTMDGVTETRKVCDFNEETQTPYYEIMCDNGEPLSSYAWRNLHATYRVHNATAARIAEDCFGPQGKKGFCL